MASIDGIVNAIPISGRFLAHMRWNATQRAFQGLHSRAT
jgi:hypothetical protein